MHKAYVEQRDGGYWITGTRISIDSIIETFNRGAAPETIRRSFPLLSLEEVYGAITFYLAHENEINEFCKNPTQSLTHRLMPDVAISVLQSPICTNASFDPVKTPRLRSDEDSIPG